MQNRHYLVPISWRMAKHHGLSVGRLFTEDATPVTALKLSTIENDDLVLWTYHWHVMGLTRGDYKIVRNTWIVVNELHNLYQFFSPLYADVATCTYPKDAYSATGKRSAWDKAIASTLVGSAMKLSQMTPVDNILPHETADMAKKHAQESLVKRTLSASMMRNVASTTAFTSAPKCARRGKSISIRMGSSEQEVVAAAAPAVVFEENSYNVLLNGGILPDDDDDDE